MKKGKEEGEEGVQMDEERRDIGRKGGGTQRLAEAT